MKKIRNRADVCIEHKHLVSDILIWCEDNDIDVQFTGLQFKWNNRSKTLAWWYIPDSQNRLLFLLKWGG